MIVTSLRLPVGERFDPRQRRTKRRRVTLQDPQRGEYDGPFLVVREVTKAEYCDWHEDDTGVPLPKVVRQVNLGQPGLKFYEIALD